MSVRLCVLKRTLQVALEDVEAPAGGVLVLLLVHTQVPLAEHGRGTIPGCRLQVRGQEGEVQGRGPGGVCTRARDTGWWVAFMRSNGTYLETCN